MTLYGSALMGRYAQARKRGGGQRTANPLSPPPPPTAELSGVNIIQLATGLADTGGACRLYGHTDPGGNWVLVDQVAWLNSQEWSDVNFDDFDAYRCTELGNNVAYAGESLASNQIDRP